MNAVATSVSLFSGLLHQKVSGMFVLRRVLEEHTTSEGMRTIIAKVDALYDAYTASQNSHPVPHYRFTQVGEKILMAMYAPAHTGAAERPIGDVMLAPILDPDTRYKVLALDALDHVELMELHQQSYHELSGQMKGVFEHLCCTKVQLLTAHLQSLQVLSRNDQAVFTYDLLVTADQILLVTFRNGREYTRIAVEAE